MSGGQQSPGGSVNIEGDRFVFASGGFEANREWLSEFWGGEASQLIKVRGGSRYNTGLPLRHCSMLEPFPLGWRGLDTWWRWTPGAQTTMEVL
ncbi:hypothetical protein [Thermogymnomonas acidicola]|uniref:hypothetical protein n=1 Tax=Thermogymnomonas acidicola TaxID=399579 RepID=UPI00094613CF|nr:hypothetical protein [Thermogymnomonas acidicola]